MSQRNCRRTLSGRGWGWIGLCAMVAAMAAAPGSGRGQETKATQGAGKGAEVYTAWPFDGKEAVKRREETAAALGVGKEMSLDLGNKVMLKLLLIPAGKFMMGSAVGEKDHRGEESPQHEVTLTKPYYAGVYKVTQAQYEQVMGKNPSMFVGKNNAADSVTWEMASEFCKKASEKTGKKVSLPTEAQWENMCRAGTATRYSFGDDESKLDENCWYRENRGGVMHPVGQKKPNAWGLYDVHGLLWEWCVDYFGAYAADQNVDPQGPASGTQHTVRGGTWGSRSFFLRSAVRTGAGAGGTPDAMSRYGFRVVVEVEGGK